MNTLTKSQHLLWDPSQDDAGFNTKA